MAEQIKMNYPMMEEMAQAFGNGAEILEATLSEVNNIAISLEEGGLLGDAGASFADGLRGPLANKIGLLQEKLDQLKQDIVDAMGDMQSSDSTSTSFYQ